MDEEAVKRITHDERAAATRMGVDEARFLVDTYYQMQDNRIRSDNQVRALAEAREPNLAVSWVAVQSRSMEDSIKSALNKYAGSDPWGVWLMSQVGIGPVIAAGMMSRLASELPNKDTGAMERLTTAGHWWSFCGLDPSKKWEKGTVRPWCAPLKRLCWIMGESFIKQQNKDGAVYGKIFKERKEQETADNEAGKFADQAKEALSRFKKKTKSREHYLQGKLPPAQINARARRYAVKIFLSHAHTVKYRLTYKEEPPMPYAIAQLNHAHYIPVPD